MKSIKTKFIALAGLGVVSTAYAQSSVTLFGTLDNAIAYYNNVGHGSLLELQGADATANQWGLKGTEDLGGGLKAVFNLTNGFNIETGKLGQGGRMFGKKAFVGLSSASAGTVTLGRQPDTTVDLVGPITGDRYGPVFSTPGDADNNDHTFRLQNAVKYTSPVYGGLQYELMYGVGGVAGSISSQESLSASALYSLGGLSLAAGYVFAKNDGPGGLGTADQTQNNAVTPLYGANPFIGSRLLTHVAGEYVFGKFTADLRYSNAQWKPYVDRPSFNRTETFNTGNLTLSYLLSPALSVDAGYTYMKSSGASSATYNNFALGAQYNLSKRTMLYALGGYSHASGTTFSEDGASLVRAGGAVGDIASVSSTPNQLVVILGLTTKF